MPGFDSGNAAEYFVLDLTFEAENRIDSGGVRYVSNSQVRSAASGLHADGRSSTGIS